MPTVKGRRQLRGKNLFREQRGFGMAESVVAVAVLGVTVVAFVVALSTGSISVREQHRETTAQGLARSQLEYTKSYPYNPAAVTYPAVTEPADYAIAVAVDPVPDTDADIQRITVTVSKSAEEILTVADYKVNR